MASFRSCVVALTPRDEVIEVRLHCLQINIVWTGDCEPIWESFRQILHGGEERVDIFRLDVRMLINSRSEIRTLRPDDTLRSREHRSTPQCHNAWVEHVHRFMNFCESSAEAPSEDRHRG